MNLLDIIIGVLCLGLAFYGLVRGLVRQIFSWAGLLLGHLAGVNFYAGAQEKLSLDFSHGEVVAYLLLFLAVYLFLRFAGLIAERWVRDSELSGTDRFAGMLAGFVKGALLSVVLVFFLVILLPRDTAFLRNSKLAPQAMEGARWMQKIFPEKIRDAFREKADGTAPSPAGKEKPSPAPQPKNRSRK